MAISLKILFICLFSVSIAGNCFLTGYYFGNENKKEAEVSVAESKINEMNPVIIEIQKEYLKKVVPYQVEIRDLQNETMLLLSKEKFVPEIFLKKTDELFEKENNAKRLTSGIIVKVASNSKLDDRIIISSYLKSGQIKKMGITYSLNSMKFGHKLIQKRIHFRTNPDDTSNDQEIPAPEIRNNFEKE
ncbi:MAG: hypothetical protein COA79_04430 [Planctomycetota bacterium]|nr:MAG: hypothetical protein COA79_04430 [Planctomycetota bacterium]